MATENFKTRLATTKFGKVKYWTKRRENEVRVEFGWRYLKGNSNFGSYWTCSGMIMNRINTDCISGGQNLDEIAEKTPVGHNRTFRRIYESWKKYHLKHWSEIPAEERAVLDALLDEAEARGDRIYSWND